MEVACPPLPCVCQIRNVQDVISPWEALRPERKHHAPLATVGDYTTRHSLQVPIESLPPVGLLPFGLGTSYFSYSCGQPNKK